MLRVEGGGVPDSGFQVSSWAEDESESCLIVRCASEAGWNTGESPVRRVGLFTTEHARNSVAVRRGWKQRVLNRRAITKVNHI